MNEDKQKICNQLCETLKLTRQYSRIEELRYVFNPARKEEYVIPVYESGVGSKIDVTADSGSQMIRDIMKGLQR